MIAFPGTTVGKCLSDSACPKRYLQRKPLRNGAVNDSTVGRLVTNDLLLIVIPSRITAVDA